MTNEKKLKRRIKAFSFSTMFALAGAPVGAGAHFGACEGRIVSTLAHIVAFYIDRDGLKTQKNKTCDRVSANSSIG